MLPFFDSINKRMGKITSNTGVRTSPYPLFIGGLAGLLLAFVFMPASATIALQMALFTAPVWLPFLLGAGAWELWINLIRSEFIAKQKYMILEIKPPRNLVKTPLAMEAFLTGIHQGPGESNWYKKFIVGAVRPWWSLEIASFEGRVHFFIWTRSFFRRLVEAQLYAQYPGVHIVEAVDYTRQIPVDPDGWGIWGCDFKHSKEDPLPIKTYVDYGLDKVQKEPEQVDPLAQVIEMMGSLGKGEYLWLQLIIRTHKGEKYNKLNPKGKAYTWKDEATELVNKIREETREPYKDPATGKEVPGFPNPTKGQIEMIAAIERNTAKLAFDVGARGIYIAKDGHFNASTIASLTGIFKPFNSESWNGIGPTGWSTMFDDYPWEINVQKMKDAFSRALIEAYRRRQFFYHPFKNDGMVMSTEELATIYHIPSSSIETPSLERIKSATGEAPANLPV